MADVRASIERLFATGRYADIQVDAEPYNDGTKGRRDRTLPHQEQLVHRRGHGQPAASPARRAPGNWRTLRTSTWGSRSPSQDAGSRRGQKRLMESNGLFLSQITPSFTYDNSYQQINIRFDVSSGPRARFTTPVLLGDVKLDPQRILKATKFRRWISHLEAHDADARQPGPRQRARALPTRKPPGSARVAGIHEVRCGNQHRPAHLANRRRAAHSW
jgi:hypothetical protein